MGARRSGGRGSWGRTRRLGASRGFDITGLEVSTIVGALAWVGFLALCKSPLTFEVRQRVAVLVNIRRRGAVHAGAVVSQVCLCVETNNVSPSVDQRAKQGGYRVCF